MTRPRDPKRNTGNLWIAAAKPKKRGEVASLDDEGPPPRVLSLLLLCDLLCVNEPPVWSACVELFGQAKIRFTQRNQTDAAGERASGLWSWHCVLQGIPRREEECVSLINTIVCRSVLFCCLFWRFCVPVSAFAICFIRLFFCEPPFITASVLFCFPLFIFLCFSELRVF